MTKYDDASWHYGGEFPSDLPDQAGGTHTGMYLAWALTSGLAGDLHLHGFSADLANLKNRLITPAAYFFRCCDGKFTDEDLNEEGNAFTKAYFCFDEGEFLKDYEATLLAGLPSLYHMNDTWQNFDKLRPIFDQRLIDWRALKSGR